MLSNSFCVITQVGNLPDMFQPDQLSQLANQYRIPERIRKEMDKLRITSNSDKSEISNQLRNNKVRFKVC